MTDYTARQRIVYFMRPAGERGPIKVGCSLKPESRRITLSEQLDCTLEIVAAVPGSMDDERRIHSLFWHLHQGGEWFEWSGALQMLMDIARRKGVLNYDALPPAKVRPMPTKRHRWTEDQKLRAKYGREIRKAEAALGEQFPHQIGHVSNNETWKTLIPEMDAFITRPAPVAVSGLTSAYPRPAPSFSRADE